MDMLQAYREKIAEGQLQADAGQLQVAEALDALAKRLSQQTIRKPGLLARLRGEKPETLRGLYIHGQVGRGKTMLMDLFFSHIEGLPKWRVHFHAFMQQIHHERAAQHTIEQIADGIAGRARLLCLDEMQIVDIADAMIMGRLYEAMQKRAVVLVTTSNLPPDGLYKDGLNRDLFLPFIAKITATMDVISLHSPKDYRLGRIKARTTYLTPLGAAADAAVDTLWNELTDGADGQRVELAVLSRSLPVPRAAHGCARFSFAALCEKPLGPPDYLALAQAFRTVFVEHVPKLKATQRNEAKRFILLIDTLYDAGTRLVLSAAVPPEQIYASGKHGFEFGRTASRLHEMQSALWWGGNIVET